MKHPFSWHMSFLREHITLIGEHAEWSRVARRRPCRFSRDVVTMASWYVTRSVSCAWLRLQPIFPEPAVATQFIPPKTLRKRSNLLGCMLVCRHMLDRSSIWSSNHLLAKCTFVCSVAKRCPRERRFLDQSVMFASSRALSDFYCVLSVRLFTSSAGAIPRCIEVLASAIVSVWPHICK